MFDTPRMCVCICTYIYIYTHTYLYVCVCIHVERDWSPCLPTPSLLSPPRSLWHQIKLRQT